MMEAESEVEDSLAASFSSDTDKKYQEMFPRKTMGIIDVGRGRG